MVFHVGSGPAGLMAAYELAVKGHAVTVFDSAPEPGPEAGGSSPACRSARRMSARRWKRR